MIVQPDIESSVGYGWSMTDSELPTKLMTQYNNVVCVSTDTNLYKFTKEKTYRVNQRWRNTTCLHHPCYDVGCYPCIMLICTHTL